MRDALASCVMPIGFSNELFSQFTEPKLTSIDQHCGLMGQSAARRRLELMREQGPSFAARQVVLQSELCVRTSSLRRKQPNANKLLATSHIRSMSRFWAFSFRSLRLS